MGHKGSKPRTGGKKLVEARDVIGQRLTSGGIPMHDTSDAHPQFAQVSGDPSGTLWGVTSGGEAWVRQDGTWERFRTPRTRGGSVTPYRGTGRLTGTSRAISEPRGRWIAATPMPGIRNGDRKRG